MESLIVGLGTVQTLKTNSYYTGVINHYKAGQLNVGPQANEPHAYLCMLYTT
jgi:hypothetical protein